MTRKNFPVVFVGDKKFFVSQRGAVYGEPMPLDQPPNQTDVLTAMRALKDADRSTHPTISVSNLAIAIRKRFGFISFGAMILALHRLGIEMRSPSRSEVFAAITPTWALAGWTIDLRRAEPGRSFAHSDSDQYSHGERGTVPTGILSVGSLEVIHNEQGVFNDA